MPRDAIAQARLDRNAALVDTMMLAATADGNVSAVELNTVLAHVLERPEFEGIDGSALAGMLEVSMRRLSSARSLEDVFHQIKERLPDHRNRVLAFGLATSIALADKKATRDELGLLKSIQAALHITEEEVSSVFQSVHAGHSLAEALGEPVERLYAETMVVVSAADGAVTHSELDAMLENLAGDPLFKDVSLENAQKYLRDAVLNLTNEGLDERIVALAHGLSTHGQRQRAYRLAVRIAHADAQPPSRSELEVLELLQATFGLSDAEVARLSVEH